jgi:hypothetical protein
MSCGDLSRVSAPRVRWSRHCSRSSPSGAKDGHPPRDKALTTEADRDAMGRRRRSIPQERRCSVVLSRASMSRDGSTAHPLKLVLLGASLRRGEDGLGGSGIDSDWYVKPKVMIAAARRTRRCSQTRSSGMARRVWFNAALDLIIMSWTSASRDESAAGLHWRSWLLRTNPARSWARQPRQVTALDEPIVRLPKLNCVTAGTPVHRGDGI